MNHANLRTKVRAHARDFNGTIFRQEDITLFLNEGIDRMIQIMPQLSNMTYLVEDEDLVTIIPKEYSHLLANYCIARLMNQDERHYEATTFMNEFEIKFAEFKEKVENGEIELLDPITGDSLASTLPVDYVTNAYFHPIRNTEESTTAPDIDEGVEEVEEV